MDKMLSEGENTEINGTLQVRASSAHGALPVVGALVLVSRAEGENAGEVLFVNRTDQSGLSRIFVLPTVSAKDSPIGAEVPSIHYNVEVIADGFVPEVYVAIPIYSGISSIQEAHLVPKLGGGIAYE